MANPSEANRWGAGVESESAKGTSDSIETSASQQVISTPLTPPDSDLRGFPFMPLDVVRLRDSRLADVEDAEVFRACVLSWCASWHQTPAASLPDDDAELARLLGYGRDLQTWLRVRAAGGLRGWIKCADGRLYHPVVAEKANEALLRKQKRSRAGITGNEVRWHARLTSPDSHIAMRDSSQCDRGAMPEGSQSDARTIAIGSPKHRNDKKDKKDIYDCGESVSAADEFSADGGSEDRLEGRKEDARAGSSFGTFWQAYPKRVGKKAAEVAWQKATKTTAPDVILAGLGRVKWPADQQYIPHPATWLNGARWEDEPPPALTFAPSVVRGAL